MAARDSDLLGYIWQIATFCVQGSTTAKRCKNPEDFAPVGLATSALLKMSA